ncbi:unnamed protein product [Eretmochelys imbricata]
MGRLSGSWDPPAWGGPWKGLLLAASVLGSCLQPAPAQTPLTIVLTPPSPAVGGGVSLAPQPAPQDFTSCIWYRSATTDASSRILTYFPGTPPVQTNDSAHTGRETAGPGCALHIAGLRLNDTGSYTVDIQSPTSPGLTTTVHLPVSEMLPRPPVTPNPTLVPEDGTFTLPCNSSPRTDTVLCLQDGSYLVPSEGLGQSSESRTLTVPNAPRADTGAYWCEVGNLVSTNLSEPSNVTVPSLSYRWFLNGIDMNETESILTVNPTSLDQLGTYKCQAHNSITGLTARMEIVVEEMLPKPTVTPNQTQVLENGTFTLTCNSSPRADTLLWLRDGASLAPSDRLGAVP